MRGLEVPELQLVRPPSQIADKIPTTSSGPVMSSPQWRITRGGRDTPPLRKTKLDTTLDELFAFYVWQGGEHPGSLTVESFLNLRYIRLHEKLA